MSAEGFVGYRKRTPAPIAPVAIFTLPAGVVSNPGTTGTSAQTSTPAHGNTIVVTPQSAPAEGSIAVVGWSSTVGAM